MNQVHLIRESDGFLVLLGGQGGRCKPRARCPMVGGVIIRKGIVRLQGGRQFRL